MNNELLSITYAKSEKLRFAYRPVEVILLGMRDIIRFFRKKESHEEILTLHARSLQYGQNSKKRSREMGASYVHPALYQRPVPGKGFGVFSKTNLKPDDIIGVEAGGEIISRAEARRRKRRGDDHAEQVTPKFYWAPNGAHDMTPLDMINHSCDPNVGRQGNVWVVRRAVRTHRDELGNDYATFDFDPQYRIKCRCGGENCRGLLTGNDWKKLGLRIRHWGFFTIFKQLEIEKWMKKNHLWVRNGKLYYRDLYRPTAPHEHEILGGEKGVLVNRQSHFQHIQIFATAAYGLMLALNGCQQAAIRDEWIYHEALAWTALLCHPNPEVVVILGGGDGLLLKQILRDPRVKRVILIDIDSDVVRFTRQFSEFWGDTHLDPRVTIVNADALQFLHNMNFLADIFFSDLTDPTESSLSTDLMSTEYFGLIKDRTRDEESLMMFQGGEGAENAFEDHMSGREKIKEVFPYLRSFFFHVPSFSTVWSGIIAGLKPLPDFGDVATTKRLFRAHPKITAAFRYLTPKTFSGMFAYSRSIAHTIGTSETQDSEQ